MKHFLFSLIILTLVACEGETTYQNQVVNQTNYPLHVSYFNAFQSSPEQMVISPHDDAIIHVRTLRGGNSNVPNCTDYLDSLQILISDSIQLVINPTDPNQWEHSSSSNFTKNVVRHKCLLEINEDDVD